MSPLTSKILIVGVPLALSLSWFVFWVARLTGTAKRLKKSGLRQPGDAPAPPEPPVQRPPV